MQLIHIKFQTSQLFLKKKKKGKKKKKKKMFAFWRARKIAAALGALAAVLAAPVSASSCKFTVGKSKFDLSALAACVGLVGFWEL
jgi:hypothetical protein